MDFMDPQHRRRNDAMVLLGYVLIGVALLLLTTILVFMAYGFGYKNGEVIQSGLLFLSSRPGSAEITIDGTRYKDNTNTKLTLPAGNYSFALSRTGYRTWQRSIAIQGGEVESYTYPFLFPTSLTATTRQTYNAAPALVTESPDRRWLLVTRPGSLTSFDMYDLTKPQRDPALLTLPDGILTSSSDAAQTLALVEWSGDSNDVLLQHTFDKKTEYIMLSRSNPTDSFNLTAKLALPLTGVQVQMSNEHYDRYIVFNTVARTLSRATLSAPTLQPYVTVPVLAFATAGDSTLLYATPDPADTGKVDINLLEDQKASLIRRSAANTTYLLALADYDGDLYAAANAASEDIGYIYKDPATQVANPLLGVAVPVRTFHLKNISYVSVAPGAQYILFESGTSFAAYDLANELGFTYTVPNTLEAPQAHAAWMDGAHLLYISQGQTIVFDYDGQNRQTLVSADPRYQPLFDPNYTFLYTFVPAATDHAQELLTSTSLRTPADQ
ncbi:MAG TPA: PEGA domain-containing protein [Candidatus Saccharimonadales bacterium]|nr:PEGA domain-containing protein [Candidatus Saccharimonadales bacterium]